MLSACSASRPGISDPDAGFSVEYAVVHRPTPFGTAEAVILSGNKILDTHVVLVYDSVHERPKDTPKRQSRSLRIKSMPLSTPSNCAGPVATSPARVVDRRSTRLVRLAGVTGSAMSARERCRSRWARSLRTPLLDSTSGWSRSGSSATARDGVSFVGASPCLWCNAKDGMVHAHQIVRL